MDAKPVIIILLGIFLIGMLIIGDAWASDENFFIRIKKRIKNKLRKKKDVEVPMCCYVNIDNVKKRIDSRVETITDLIQKYSEEYRTGLGDSSYSTRLSYGNSYDFNTDKKCIIQCLDELEDYLYLYREYYKDSKKL